ncbi:hypothetical protein A3Q56_00406 [Intoshia linei]|uniref:Uncharacterized protein n=1 Tax=Intoshia linei TaxID=1819745 RepID=A0A177BBT7_9BILA|nr:hypothetical protein A3Q56_00406 [Intoshia linei]
MQNNIKNTMENATEEYDGYLFSTDSVIEISAPKTRRSGIHSLTCTEINIKRTTISLANKLCSINRIDTMNKFRKVYNDRLA